MEWLLAAVVGLIVIAGGVYWHHRSLRRHTDALRALLDGADELEAQLLEYRNRMTNLKQLLARLPSDMTAPAMASINPEGEVRVALQDVLAHRLWIKREGATATLEALDQAGEALKRSRVQMEQQLKLLDEVGRQLEAAGHGLREAYKEAGSSRPGARAAAPGMAARRNDDGSTLH